MSIPSLFVHLVSITMFVSTLVTTNLPSQYSWPKYATKCANEYGNDVNNLKVSNPVGLLCGHYQRTCTVTANTDIHVAFDLVTSEYHVMHTLVLLISFGLSFLLRKTCAECQVGENLDATRRDTNHVAHHRVVSRICLLTSEIHQALLLAF